MLNETPTVNESLPKGSRTDSSPTPPCLAISTLSCVKGTPERIKAWLTSSQPDSPASPSPSRDIEKEAETSATHGLKPLQPFAKYNRDSRSLRMLPGSCLMSMSGKSLPTWPKVGWMRGGVCSVGLTSARLLTARDCGSSLRRPTVSDHWSLRLRSLDPLLRRRPGEGRLAEQLARAFHVMISPTCVEILMRWPKGWSASAPLGTGRFLMWRRSRGKR